MYVILSVGKMKGRDQYIDGRNIRLAPSVIRFEDEGRIRLGQDALN
jgi:hypothetical protein